MTNQINNITVTQPTEKEKTRCNLIMSIHDMLYDPIVANKGYITGREAVLVETVKQMIEFLIDNAGRNIVPNIETMYSAAYAHKSYKNFAEVIPTKNTDYYPVKLEYLKVIAEVLYKNTKMRDYYMHEMNGWLDPENRIKMYFYYTPAIKAYSKYSVRTGLILAELYETADDELCTTLTTKELTERLAPASASSIRMALLQLTKDGFLTSVSHPRSKYKTYLISQEKLDMLKAIMEAKE